ncbi:MAG: hypothetical protein R3F60_19470 [bacterium]
MGTHDHDEARFIERVRAGLVPPPPSAGFDARLAARLAPPRRTHWAGWLAAPMAAGALGLALWAGRGPVGEGGVDAQVAAVATELSVDPVYTLLDPEAAALEDEEEILPEDYAVLAEVLEI